MSRIGKKPIVIPKGVDVKIEGNMITISGKNGTLSRELVGVDVSVQEGKIVVKPNESHPKWKSMHGLMRTLIANMVHGVNEGVSKTLTITGTGYKAEPSDQGLTLYLGYIKPIQFRLPKGITASVEEKNTKIVLKGYDKELLGDVAARIRRLRPVEPYKGKGIAYLGEKIVLKEGKKAGGK